MFKRKKNFFHFALLVFILLSFYFFINSSLFTIKNINFKKESVDCIGSDEDVKKNLEISNQNIFFFNPQNMEENFKKEFYCIKRISFVKKFPDVVEVTIIGRNAKATLIPLLNKEATAAYSLENIATPSAQDYLDIFLVDDEGIVFSKGDGGLTLPTVFIYYRDVLNLGDNLGVYMINSIKILDKIKTLGIDIKSAKFVMDEFLITDTIPKIIFKLTDKIDIQLASLQLILEQAKIDGRNLEFIDLRFDKPIVKFAPKKK